MLNPQIQQETLIQKKSSNKQPFAPKFLQKIEKIEPSREWKNHLQLILCKIVPKFFSLSNDTVLWNGDSALGFGFLWRLLLWDLKEASRRKVVMGYRKNGIGALGFVFFFMKIVFEFWEKFQEEECSYRDFKKNMTLGF